MELSIKNKIYLEDYYVDQKWCIDKVHLTYQSVIDSLSPWTDINLYVLVFIDYITVMKIYIFLEFVCSDNAMNIIYFWKLLKI